MQDLQHIPENDIEQKLWDYIDGISDEKEIAVIEKLIAENTEWRTKYHELLDVHQMIRSTELEHPSLRFTKNVMEEIAKYHIAPATKKYINNKIVFSIGAFFITLVVGFIIYGISQVNWSSANDSKSSFGVDLSKVDYSTIFNNTYVNVFMMFNVILGLMLLDRYLNSKRKKFAKLS